MKRSGFTLIELLVALVLLGLLTALALGSFRDASQQQRRLIRTNNVGEQLRAVDDLLRSLLSNANPTISATQNSHDNILFRGSTNNISFLAPLPLSFGASDIVAYQLQFTGDGEMRLGWHLDRDAAGSAAAGNVGMILLNTLSNAIVIYYGVRERDEEPRWTSSWIEQATLPKLIRVRFTWRSQQQDWLFAPVITEKTCSLPSPNAICAH